MGRWEKLHNEIKILNYRKNSHPHHHPLLIKKPREIADFRASLTLGVMAL
jgi:hypothetical protein